MRAFYFALFILTATSASAEITLRDLHEGGVIQMQNDEQLCPEWAAELDNKEPQEVDTYQGFQKFYWARNWGNENDFKLYQSLDGHTIVVREDYATKVCSMQVFGPMS